MESHPMMFRIRQSANNKVYWRDDGHPENAIGVKGVFTTDADKATMFTRAEVAHFLNRSESLPSEFILELVPQRFKDALAIDEGAVNMLAISNALVRACHEVFHERVSTPSKDPAVILMVHQMAHLCGFSGGLDLTDYMAAQRACREKGGQ